MRAATIIALALCAACGPPTQDCPDGEDLLPWVYPVGSAELSQCNRAAEMTSGPSGGTLRSSYRGSAKTVTLFAQFQLLGGSGHFEVFAGKESGAIVNRKTSGPLSVSGEVVEGFAPLSMQGLADDGASMQWRVSDVHIE